MARSRFQVWATITKSQRSLKRGKLCTRIKYTRTFCLRILHSYIYIPHAIRNGQGETSQRVVPASSRRRRRKKKKSRNKLFANRSNRSSRFLSFSLSFPFLSFPILFFFQSPNFLQSLNRSIDHPGQTDGRKDRRKSYAINFHEK